MNNKSLVPALDRGMDIIELLESNPKGLSFSDIQTKLNIPKPSLVRLLYILLKRRYIRGEERTYKLGFKLLSLGSNVQSSLDLREIARPFMEELLLKTNETVELEIFDEGGLLIIEKLENYDSPIRLFSKVGGRHVNMHSNASGKVALAFLSEKERSSWLKAHNLKKNTPFTIIDVKKIKKELVKIQKECVGYDFQEGRLEVSRIASPIISSDKKLIGVLNIAGPYFRINPKTKIKLGNIVREFANKISGKLGYEKY